MPTLRCRRVILFPFLVVLISASAAIAAPPNPDADEPWLRMDYGPFLSASVGLGADVAPVNKGIVVRLRTLDGTLTDLHAVFDTDLVAWRCAWAGNLALRGIVFDGPHGTFPEIAGDPMFRMPAVPGAAAGDGIDLVDPREEPWGPIPADIARWSGLYLDGDDVIFEYTVGPERHRVRERVWAAPDGDRHAFVREIAADDAVTFALTDVSGQPMRAHAQSSSGVFKHRDRGAGPRTISRVRLPVGGGVRIAIGHAEDDNLAPPADTPPLSMQEAIDRARPRWGAPLPTRGVIDDPLGGDGDVDRFVHARGSASLGVVTADDAELELLRDGAPATESPIHEAVILRLPPTGDDPLATDAPARLGFWPSDAGRGTHELNVVTGEADLRLDGVTWRRGVAGRSLDFDGTAAAWLHGMTFDLARDDLTVGAWIHTTSDGTVFAVAPPDGDWAQDGVTLFLRGGRLAFDVGWVGVVGGGPEIADGTWHHVAATWAHGDGAVRLYVDGEQVASGTLPLNTEARRDHFVGRFGWTNDNFPAVSRFSGYMDGPCVLGRVAAAQEITTLAAVTGEPLVEATIVRTVSTEPDMPPSIRLDADAATLVLTEANAGTYEVRRRRGPRSVVLAWAAESDGAGATPPFRTDCITWPDDNPSGSWLRFGAFTFLPPEHGTTTSAAITTWSGDVWRIDGLDEDLDDLRWTRMATGLNQPFGITVRGDELLVLGRDQITRLHDRNGDGEADFYENVTNDGCNSTHFHEPASGLLVEPDGSLLYHKAARHAKHGLHDHHGTVLRVSPDGSTTTVVARGFRAPIGLARLPDGTLLGSDQEGHWMPANRINLITPAGVGETPRFYGNGWAAQPGPVERIERGGEMVHPAWDPSIQMEQPLCWLHPTVDRSPSSHVYVDHPAWGPLNGSILGLSYGTGDVYSVLGQKSHATNGEVVAQGGIVKLGIQLPTGLLAGQIHPDTGDLYVCGLFGWSSDRTAPGGFYRVRPQPESWPGVLNVPYMFVAADNGLGLRFLSPVDPETAADPDNWTVTAWNYVRDADYGSATYSLRGRRDARTTLPVDRVVIGEAGTSVRLLISDFQPAMQLHVEWSIHDAAGTPLNHEAHLTIHATEPIR